MCVSFVPQRGNALCDILGVGVAIGIGIDARVPFSKSIPIPNPIPIPMIQLFQVLTEHTQLNGVQVFIV